MSLTLHTFVGNDIVNNLSFISQLCLVVLNIKVLPHCGIKSQSLTKTRILVIYISTAYNKIFFLMKMQYNFLSRGRGEWVGR